MPLDHPEAAVARLVARVRLLEAELRQLESLLRRIEDRVHGGRAQLAKLRGQLDRMVRPIR